VHTAEVWTRLLEFLLARKRRSRRTNAPNRCRWKRSNSTRRKIWLSSRNGLRMCINEDSQIASEKQRIQVADLVDHYVQTELAEEADWRSHATRIAYREFLKRWIRPHWAIWISEMSRT